MPGNITKYLGGLHTKDGRLLVVFSAGRDGWSAWFTGAGDDPGPPLARGKGDKIRASFTGPETKTVEISWEEPVEIQDGYAVTTGTWSLDDTANVGVKMPATPVTSNPGAGNVQLVPTGLGFNAIIPAAGDGSDDLTYADAVPVRNFDYTGYWDVDLETGDVTPNANGSGNADLYDTDITAYLMTSIPFAVPSGYFTIDGKYEAKWVHPKWKLVFEIDKQSLGTGEFAAFLACFRKNIT